MKTSPMLLIWLKSRIYLKKVFTVFDGWIRESLSELINNVFLSQNFRQDYAKRTKTKMENLYDKEPEEKSHYCRSLKILI